MIVSSSLHQCVKMLFNIDSFSVQIFWEGGWEQRKRSKIIVLFIESTFHHNAMCICPILCLLTDFLQVTLFELWILVQVHFALVDSISLYGKVSSRKLRASKYFLMKVLQEWQDSFCSPLEKSHRNYSYFQVSSVQRMKFTNKWMLTPVNRLRLLSLPRCSFVSVSR